MTFIAPQGCGGDSFDRPIPPVDTTMTFRSTLLAIAIAAILATPAPAQRRQPNPEERIERLEKQVNQVQRRVFGRQPVDTAGYVLDPALTQSDLATINARLESIERQMAELTRTSEENANRVATLETELFRLKAEAERRSREPAAEPEPATDPVDEARPDDGPPPRPQPKFENSGGSARGDSPAVPPVRTRAPSPGDPEFNAAGEQAYDRGYQLWLQKKYDQAIAELRAMASSFPGHRRVSWANNLAGRAMLDKGEYRAAAEALLANYRGNPNGERAADSLFYLGQASMRLRQPAQACKAYTELENVYGATLRADLRRLLPAAKAEAKCG
jgi:TolA-binding protein